MNAEIKPLLTARQRLEKALQHESQDLPREANTYVRVGDVRAIMHEADLWKTRALAAGYTPEASEFYASLTQIREGRPPMHLMAAYEPTQMNDPRPYKVSQLLADGKRTVAAWPTETEAFECLLAIVIRADKAKDQGKRP
ncbi:MAG: hypothetical protein NVV72_01225 [Asticcacaulis sp.]|nr:hypothetical protein [Asticcacaulis sp.]